MNDTSTRNASDYCIIGVNSFTPMMTNMVNRLPEGMRTDNRGLSFTKKSGKQTFTSSTVEGGADLHAVGAITHNRNMETLQGYVSSNLKTKFKPIEDIMGPKLLSASKKIYLK